MEFIPIIIPIILLGIWVGIIVLSSKKLKEARKVEGLEKCWNYYEIKETGRLNPDTDMERAYLALKKFRNQTFLFGIISMVIGFFILELVSK